jgi:hypothetical protein
MRFLCMYKSAKAEGAPPTAEDMANMGAFMEESFKSGILLAAEGCMPSAHGARIRLADGGYSVTDGPFTEAKELVGGLAIINASSKEQAVEYTKRFLNIAGDGETEIRQLYEVSALDTVNTHA